MTRSTTWRDLVVRADPDHTRNSRMVIEYEFSAPGRGFGGDDRTHEGGQRIFKGDYQTRGPYTAETVASAGITWNGIPVNWDDDEVTWND